MNLEAVDEMMERFPDIQLLFIESGGDNLSATFSLSMRRFLLLMWQKEIRFREKEDRVLPDQIFW